MVAGTWTNQDGLYLQFGTNKAIPELGGDWLMYGPNREIETYISLATTQFGGGTGATVGGFVQVPALPNGFSSAAGTGTAIQAGVQSLTTFFPLQQTAAVTTASSGNGLILLNPQLWVDQIELVSLVSANAGTGGATGLSGIGLVYVTEAGASSQFAQVAPSAGVQLMGAINNTAMTAGATWTFRANANNSATTGGSGWIQYSTAATTNTPVAPAWMGNVPITTSFLNGVSGPLANNGYISALATGGTYTGTTAAGLLKLRIRYNIYGAINQ